MVIVIPNNQEETLLFKNRQKVLTEKFSSVMLKITLQGHQNFKLGVTP